jgi:hypothetical protein
LTGSKEGPGVQDIYVRRSRAVQHSWSDAIAQALAIGIAQDYEIHKVFL